MKDLKCAKCDILITEKTGFCISNMFNPKKKDMVYCQSCLDGLVN